MKNDQKNDRVAGKRLRLELERVKVLSVQTGVHAGDCTSCGPISEPPRPTTK
jgi:hypothetical protein